MARRQAILQDVGGELVFTVPESGTVEPTSPAPTVDIYDPRGALVAQALTVTLTDTPTALRLTIPPENAGEAGENYRAAWSYTVDGQAVRRNQTFDVCPALLYPPITTAAQLAQHFPLLEGRDFPGSTKIVDLGVIAWNELCERLVARGKNPNLIIDPAPLETPLAALWAAHVARNYRPGGRDSNEWQQWAAARDAECNERLDAALANLHWYDANADLKPSAAEEDRGVATVFLSR